MQVSTPFQQIRVGGRSYDSLILGDAPSLYLPMREVTGTTAVDLSDKGNNGTFTGGYTLGQQGPLARTVNGGGGVLLNGTTGNVAVANPNENTSTFSAEIWLKTTATDGKIFFAHYDSGAGKRMWEMMLGQTAIGATGNELQCIVTSDGAKTKFKRYYGTTAINNGAWHHLALTWNAGTFTIYVDGAAQTPTKETDNSFSSLTNSTANLTIGAGLNSAALDSPIAASISLTAIYPTALTANQIKAHYLAGINGF